MITNLVHRGPGWRRASALAALAALVGTVLLVSSSVLIASAAPIITSGNSSPTANHTPNGWTDPGNAWDGNLTNYATATQSREQGYSSFNLPAIADGSIITGIRVTAVAKTTDTDCRLGVSLSWNNGANTTTRQDQNLGTSDTTVTFGGVPGASGNDTNTFGRAWTPSELTNANFVVIVRSQDPGSACTNSATTSLKSIQVAVAYRPGTAGTGNSDIVPGAICGQADFNFVVDTSGSIGSTNMATVRSQLQAFADNYQVGGDGLYSMTSFSSSASTRTSGFVNAATFKTAAANLPGSSGRTWTQAGINTAATNVANDRAGVPNIMFVLTDGSPNMSSAAQPPLSLPQTWQDASDAAIGAANSVRSTHQVYAVFVGTGDSNLTDLFGSTYAGQYTSYVMKQIGGGSYSSIANFGDIANGLLDLLGCRNIVVTKVTDSHPSNTTFSGSVSNAQGNNVPATWSLTSNASGSTTRTSTTVSVARNRAHTVTEAAVPANWTMKGWYGPISTTALCPTDPTQYSGTSASIPSGAANTQVCVFNSFASKPALTLKKSSPTANYSAVGATITYSYLLTNSGNVPLVAPFSVSDDKASVTCPQTPSPLAPAASITCNATYTVTQADLDAGSVTNHATGHAVFNGGPVDSNQDSVTVPAVQTRTLGLTKTDDLNPAKYDHVGQVVTYTITATNTGNTTLHNVTVSDNPALAGFGCTPTSPVASLAPGATVVCTGTHTITQADLDAGSFADTASATSTEADAPNASDTVYAAQSPALSLKKTANPTTYSTVGQTIGYSFVLTNTGNVTLSAPFAISDDKATDEACPPTPTSLAPGGSITCTASYTITQADIDAGSVTNHATGTGQFGQQTVTSNEDQATVTAVQNPGLTLDKTSSTANYSTVGATISYSYLLTNGGNVTLSAPYSVTDDRAPSVSCPATPLTLAPGASVTCTASYTVTQADIDAGSVTNHAIGHATYKDKAVDSNPDQVTVPAIQRPALSLVKSADPATYDHVGQTIAYSYLVKNTGNVTLAGPVTVSDNKVTVTCPAGGLAPGASMTCTASHSITQADLDAGFITNDARAHANGTDSNTDTATVTAVANPAISITKGVSPDGNPPFDPSITAAVGSTAYYRVVVTNTGNVTLTSVTLADDLVPALGGCSVPATLAPSASFTCDYTAAVVLGATKNTATAGAKEVDPVKDSATVTGVEPSLDVVKTVDKTTAQPGDVLTYTITLTNSGTADAKGIDVKDDVTGLSAFGTISDVTPAATGPGNLEWAGQTIPADGQPHTYSFKLTLNDSGWAAGDTLVKNTVVVTGTPNPCAQPEAQGVPPCGTTTTVTTASHLTIRKTVSPTSIVAGTSVPTTYTIVVSNTGDGTTANPVVVTDLGMPSFFSQTTITCTSDPGSVPITAPTCDYGALVSTGIDFGPMAAGQTITIVISGYAQPSEPGVSTNVAWACPGDVAGVAQVGGPGCVHDDATLTVTEIAPTPTPTSRPPVFPTPEPPEPTFPPQEPTPTVLPPVTPEPTPTPTIEPTQEPTPSPSGSVAAITSKPVITPPPTNTDGQGGSGGGFGLAAALATLVAAAAIVLLATPRRRAKRR